MCALHSLGAQQLGAVFLSGLAGSCTAIGGLVSLWVPPNMTSGTAVQLLAFLLSTALGAMLTVAYGDLLFEPMESIGLAMTLLSHVTGAAVGAAIHFSLDWVQKRLNNVHSTLQSAAAQNKSCDSSDSWRMQRLGIMSAVVLCLHNLPEGIAVALAAQSSSAGDLSFNAGQGGQVSKLSKRLALSVAIHNIPEGFAVAVPLRASGRYGPWMAAVLAGCSGLSEPLGALMTVLATSSPSPKTLACSLAGAGGLMAWTAFVEVMPEILRLQQSRAFAAGTAAGFLSILLSHMM